jgi:MFS family permease
MSVKGKVRRSLRVSFLDGLSSSGMLGLADTCMMPFAIALGASPAQVASLGSLPNLMAAVVQSQSNLIADWLGNRLRMLVTVIFSQMVVLAAAACIPIFPEEGRVTALIALAMFYTMLGGLASPVWGSLMCEYLPLRQRSGYFGWRQRILGVVVIAAGLAAGGILQKFGHQSLAGFGIIFGTAAVFRLISWIYSRQMYDPVKAWNILERRSHIRFEPHAKANFIRFLIFNGVMMAGVQLAGPLQSVYLLKDLHLKYLTYMLLISASNMTMFYLMASWGRHADLSGNIQVIRVVSWMMPVIPLLWLVSYNPVYLFVLQLFSGVAWAGYNLCGTNFIYDAVPSSERVRATSFYNMSNGIAIFLGALIGGQLIAVLPPIRGFSYLSLNVLSAIVRLIAVVFFLRGVKEVRHVQQVRSMDLFNSVVGLKPIPGIAPSRLRRWFRPHPPVQPSAA